MKNIIAAGIIGVCVITAGVLCKMGCSTAVGDGAVSQSLGFELFGHQNIVYRIDKTTGRTDILFPGTEGAFLIPIWQMNPAGEMNEEEQARWGQITKAVSNYLAISQDLTSLGKEEPSQSE